LANERDQYKGIIEGARHEGALLARIHDSVFTGKKPFDMFGILSDGRGLAVEVKDVEKLPRDIVGLLESHQVSWLKAYASRGGAALVVVHCKADRCCHVWRMDRTGRLILRQPLRKAGGVWLGIVEACNGE
jgi:penicillin-binding protein-related factor A (putative recombinase)